MSRIAQCGFGVLVGVTGCFWIVTASADAQQAANPTTAPAGDRMLITAGPIDEHSLFDEPNWKDRVAGQFKGIEVYDLKRSARLDMRADQLKNATTAAIGAHVMTSSVVGFYLILYGDPRMGIARALQTSGELQEFIARPDFAKAVVEIYRTKEFDKPSAEIGERLTFFVRASLELSTLDQIVMYPSLIGQSRGFEKPLLEQLHRRLSDMMRINDEFNALGQQRGSGLSFAYGTGVELTLELAKRSDAALYQKLVAAQSARPINHKSFIDALDKGMVSDKK